MIGSHRWQKTMEKLPSFSLRSRGQESDPILTECQGVEYSYSRAAGYLKIGWRTNTGHAYSGQLSIKR